MWRRHRWCGPSRSQFIGWLETSRQGGAGSAAIAAGAGRSVLRAHTRGVTSGPPFHVSRRQSRRRGDHARRFGDVTAGSVPRHTLARMPRSVATLARRGSPELTKARIADDSGTTRRLTRARALRPEAWGIAPRCVRTIGRLQRRRPCAARRSTPSRRHPRPPAPDRGQK